MRKVQIQLRFELELVESNEDDSRLLRWLRSDSLVHYRWARAELEERVVQLIREEDMAVEVYGHTVDSLVYDDETGEPV